MKFAEILDRYGERPFLIEDGVPLFYSELTHRMELVEEEVLKEGRETPYPLVLDWRIDSIVRLFTLWHHRCSVFLGTTMPGGNLAPFLPHSPLLILRTGGTTGKPTHVVHSLDRILDRYQPEQRPPSRLLPLYAADHIAGLDALLQAFHRGGTLVLSSSRTARDIARTIERDAVEVLPATPTFLQFMLLSGELEGVNTGSVRVIPHGAEPMPEALRLRLKEVFPNAQLRQRFGLTELGPLPVEEDPRDASALLLKPVPGFEWRIEDGQLLIRSPSRMLGTLEDGPVSSEDPWHQTGDLAELTPDGGLRILGRREFVINVGGTKVIPELVESLLLSQNGVRDAFVYGRPNPLTGESVCADVVYEGEPDHMSLLSTLRRQAREQSLSLAHVPTRIEAVEVIEKTPAGKRRRSRV